MQEAIGYAAFTETPCVVVDVQRGAPSTGLPTLVGQGDVMQARWGSHGHYEVIAYSPSSPQECFDFIVKAFNTADRFRMPVFILADEVVGHMTERVVIPTEGDIPIARPKRPARPPGNGFRAFQPDDDLIPPMPVAGEGYRIHVTGLTHDERGYPATDAENQDKLVRRLVDKVLRHAEEIIEYEEYCLDDAEVAVIAYGCTARSARRAVNVARQRGLKVGLLRPITLWPFPENQVRALDSQVGAFVVPELNLGQIAREVERFPRRPVLRVGHGGGVMLPPEPIVAAIQEAM